MGDDILILILSGIILVFIVGFIIMIILWRTGKNEKEVFISPTEQFRDAWGRDSDGNGIPDHVEEMLRRMEKRMGVEGKPYQGIYRSGGYAFQFKSEDGETWGKMVRDVNGRRTVKEWGEPPRKNGTRYPYEADEEKILDEEWNAIFDDYVSGRISKAEFMDKAEDLKGK